MTSLTKYQLPIAIGLGLVFITVIGLIDTVTGYEISFAPLYLLPITLITWVAGTPYGFAAAGLSAVVWLMAEIVAGRQYSHPAIHVWNTFMRLVTYVTMVWLLGRVQREMALEKALARSDPITGAANQRYFQELFKTEAIRAHRYGHSFVVGYIDLDNFKWVNDTLGHSIGDLVLRTVVEVLQHQLRQTDVVARLGGDEFALLLPETGENAAREVFTRLHQSLQNKMHAERWQVTFSIGVLVCESMTDRQSLGDVIRQVDRLMYSVKTNGKNGIRYEHYGPGNA
jgi:diguanylate cyclase (GGDEF)-like protein